jgi:hypothetical protein
LVQEHKDAEVWKHHVVIDAMVVVVGLAAIAVAVVVTSCFNVD